MSRLPPPLPVGEWSDDTRELAPVPDRVEVAEARGAQMSVPEQSLAAVAHAFRAASLRARELIRREGGLPHAIWHGAPESLADIAEYRASRAWVPPGHEGGIAEAEGSAYYATIGPLGVALGLWIAWTFARQLRLAVTSAIFLTVLTISLIWLLG